MKKVFSCVLALVMVITMITALPFTASAETTIGSVGFGYHFKNGEVINFQPQAAATYKVTHVEWEAVHDGQPFSNNQVTANKANDWNGYKLSATVTANSGYKFTNTTAMLFNGVSLAYKASFTADNQYNVYNSGGKYYLRFTVTFRYMAFALEQLTTGQTNKAISAYSKFYIKDEIITCNDAPQYDEVAHFSHWDSEDADIKNESAIGTDIKMQPRHNSLVTACYEKHSLTTTLTQKATFKADGKKSVSCNKCAYAQPKIVIPSANVLERDDFTDGGAVGKVLYYNGENQHIGVTLWHYDEDTGETIIPFDDYDVIYPESSYKVGKYTAKIVLQNDYEGEATYQYEIFLGKPQVKAKAGVNAITLSWAKVPGAKHYRVYGYNTKTGKYSRIVNTNKLSYTRKGRTAGTQYVYLVRAYFINAAGKEVLSPYTKADNVSIYTLCSAPKAKAAVSGKTVTLKWAKISNAKFYRVYQYNTKTKQYTTLVKSTTKLDVKLTKQAKGTHYYLVRAFNKGGAGSNYSTKTLTKAVVK
ncbi:MAG: hypothetical protein IJI67_05895 [Clostridia bacterium]|nr:hypothetical protein [Clostridia bacterium]